MSTGFLNIDSVELISTLRSAHFQGAPSSQDYNDSQRETLQDIAALAQALNNFVIPLLNTITNADSQGNLAINGDTILASGDPGQSLFVDAVDGEPLTLAAVLERLSSLTQAQQTSLDTLTARVTSLATLLSSSNQDDISKAIQGYSAQLAGFYNQLSVLQNALLLTQSQQTNDLSAIATLQTQVSQLLAGGGGGSGGGGGGTGNANILLPLVTAHASTTLRADYGDSQTVFTNSGATQSVTLTLPLLPTGSSVVYRGVIETAQLLAFAARSGLRIYFADVASTLGGSISSSTIGSTLTLKSAASGWFVEDATGDWSVA